MKPLIFSLILISLLGIFISFCFADATSVCVMDKDSEFYKSCSGTYILVIDANTQKYYANGVEVGKGAYEIYRDALVQPKSIEERVLELEGKVVDLEKAKVTP